MSCRRKLPTYEINLDLPLEKRYAEVATDLVPLFNKVVNKFIGKNPKVILEVLRDNNDLLMAKYNDTNDVDGVNKLDVLTSNYIVDDVVNECIKVIINRLENNENV